MRREVMSRSPAGPSSNDGSAADSVLKLDCGHQLPAGPADAIVEAGGRPQVDAVVEAGGRPQVDCRFCDERLIPAGTTIGRRTPTFDHRSVPPALLDEHRTNAWAELVVLSGSVAFEEQEPPWTATAVPGRPVVIVPRRDHRITPDADARFHVQFHDLPAAPGDPVGRRPRS